MYSLNAILLVLLLACSVGAMTLQEQLGFKADDVVLIINADDVGMCHSANQATFKAFEEGVLTSATVMMPCPWVPEVARWAKAHPKADFGLHLVQTSEWHDYRWGPVAGREAVPGLVDNQGYFWASIEDVYKHSSPEEAYRESLAQVKLAQQLGLEFSHFDSHMGTLQYNQDYWKEYLRLAREFDVPLRLGNPAMLERFGLNGRYELVRQAGIIGVPLVDFGTFKPDPTSQETWAASYDAYLKQLKPGVHELLVHLALDTPEIHAITGNWHHRYWDFLWVTSPKTKALVEKLDIKLIGYRPIRELQRKLRAEASGA